VKDSSVSFLKVFDYYDANGRARVSFHDSKKAYKSYIVHSRFLRSSVLYQPVCNNWVISQVREGSNDMVLILLENICNVLFILFSCME